LTATVGCTAFVAFCFQIGKMKGPSAQTEQSAGDRNMNRVRPYGIADIVDRDAEGLPKQIFWPEGPKIAIGPAFKFEEQALVGNTHRHTAQIFIHDADGKVIFNWWEVSQSALRGRMGHTEQKALLRMRLRPGLYVLIQGQYPCCPWGFGCMNALADAAEINDTMFDYRASGNGAVYHFSREVRRSVWDPP
jgi:hypothetical protein